jgi:hypothetical protein
VNGTSLAMSQTRIDALEKVPNWGWGKNKEDRPFGASSPSGGGSGDYGDDDSSSQEDDTIV